MAVGLKVDFLWFSIGTSDFFHSFFSTICGNLEDEIWGSKYPTLMNELYSGVLSLDKMEDAQKELKQIKEKFKELAPEKVIWDIENSSKLPPWGDSISKDIKNLSDYFITSDGKNLFDVLEEAIQEALEEQVNIEVKNL